MNTIRSGYRLFCKPWWKHWLSPQTYFYYVKYKWQRANRGWADCDVWSLDGYLVEWMPDALRRLKATKHGIPLKCISEEYDKNGDLTEKSLEEGEKKWDGILDAIIEGFEANKRLHGPTDGYEKEVGPYPSWDLEDINKPKPEVDAWNEAVKPLEARDQKKFEEGMKLFTEYFNNLWD
jgi:hypothetical protein